MMRTVLILVLLVVVMVLLGWIRYSGTSQSATITVDKQEIRKDSDRAAEKVHDLVNPHVAPRQAVDSPR
jgi:hypothetical protein